ncbi:hypothetical protein [Methylophilus glucosoxydans]|uniref:hypothetical protein n=1 Tax=Methylophilus glucosoxydans TaxID=752553 RepID=UPI00367022EF
MHIKKNLTKEFALSHAMLQDTEITPAFVASQLQLQGITLDEQDLLQTTQHYRLLFSHAERVMSWPLDEHIEPAPEFRPQAAS